MRERFRQLGLLALIVTLGYMPMLYGPAFGAFPWLQSL
jgi:hypothetical protein